MPGAHLIGNGIKVSDREKVKLLRKEVEVGLNNWLQEKENKVRQGENIVIKLSDGSAVVVSYGLKNFGRMGVDGFAMACPSCYLKVKEWGDNIGAKVGDILNLIDGKLSNNEYTSDVYVGGKKLTVGVWKESSENSPETLKTFLEILTITGGGKATVVAGEKVVAGSIEVGGKLKDGAKKVFTKTDEFHSKTKVEKVDVASGVKNDILDKHFGGKIKLADHEDLSHGGHTKSLHIGKEPKFLKDRVNQMVLKNPERAEGIIATTYPSEKIAESVIGEVLSKSKNVNKIEKWLNGNKDELMISGNIGKEIGYGVEV